MNVSQNLNHLNDNNYDDDITVNGIPKGYFPAVTSNTISEGSSTREIGVMLLELEQSAGGTMSTNSGLYVRLGGESAVKVTVSQDGNEVASNTQSYS